MLKIIALGNTLRGDDGIGPVVLGRLGDMNIPGMILLNLGSDAFHLLDHLLQPEPILLIDCARMGLEPGEIGKFTLDNRQLNRMDQFISLHGFSFSEIYHLASMLGPVAPCQCIGIEPAVLGHGKQLSSVVQSSIPTVIQMVFEEMHLYEEKNNHN